MAMCRSWFIGLHRFLAVRAGAFYWHRFWVPSSGALWRRRVGLGSFVLSVLFLGGKGVFSSIALRGSCYRSCRAGCSGCYWQLPVSAFYQWFRWAVLKTLTGWQVT